MLLRLDEQVMGKRSRPLQNDRVLGVAVVDICITTENSGADDDDVGCQADAALVGRTGVKCLDQDPDRSHDPEDAEGRMGEQADVAYGSPPRLLMEVQYRTALIQINGSRLAHHPASIRPTDE